MPRLRALADTYSFPLIMDDSVGNSVDTEILPYADIVVTSLSKIFSGAANVMGGRYVKFRRSDAIQCSSLRLASS